jgi:hypothetical protein
MYEVFPPSEEKQFRLKNKSEVNENWEEDFSG